MFKVAFLQDLGNGRLRIEEKMLKEEFERRGIPVVLYTLKRIQRRNLPLSLDSFIAGDMDAMHGAMNQLKIDIPAPNDYPESLTPFLCRRVWKSTLGEVEGRVLDESGPPVFVKPSARRKNFTARVVGPFERLHADWSSEQRSGSLVLRGGHMEVRVSRLRHRRRYRWHGSLCRRSG